MSKVKPNLFPSAGEAENIDDGRECRHVGYCILWGIECDEQLIIEGGNTKLLEKHFHFAML